MILRILIDQNLDDDFCQYLMSVISKKLLNDVEATKLRQWEQYFKLNDIKTTPYGVVKSAAKNLKYTVVDNKAVIMIDNNVKIDNKYSLYSLCKLINNGNLQTKPYPIFTDTFERIAKNINKYKLLYGMR